MLKITNVEQWLKTFEKALYKLIEQLVFTNKKKEKSLVWRKSQKNKNNSAVCIICYKWSLA